MRTISRAFDCQRTMEVQARYWWLRPGTRAGSLQSSRQDVFADGRSSVADNCSVRRRIEVGLRATGCDGLQAVDPLRTRYRRWDTLFLQETVLVPPSQLIKVVNPAPSSWRREIELRDL